MNKLPRSLRQRVFNSFAVFILPVLLAGCGRTASEEAATTRPGDVRGTSIPLLATNSEVRASGTNFVPADWSRPDVVEDGFIRLGYDKLSGFKFDVYEVYSETNAGRALLRSDDTIPAPMKAYDGRRVTITGFVLPLRLKRGLVTEFLLLRDQGTCCFGARAQINHFIRVRFPPGLKHGEPVPWKVSGTLRVGEIYVQGYLTGIYQMEAEQAEELAPFMRTSGAPAQEAK